MGSFQETGEFRGRKKCDVAPAPSPNDHGFLLIYNLIENAGQILTEARIGRFTRHEAPNRSVRHSCTGSAIRGDAGMALQNSHRACRL